MKRVLVAALIVAVIAIVIKAGNEYGEVIRKDPTAAAAPVDSAALRETARRDSIYARQTKIAANFNADYSHRNLVALVKKNLHDPESFEHVKTAIDDKGERGVWVLMEYRAKNAFGGKITHSIQARTSVEGEILQIIEQN